ncbi:alanine--tRNA ligase [Gammaproteobacteria bacterium 45_16_T64]|nr:alanine--tRNA ligase [Gammaproteobacteria bacterium 45_16_T64]
MKTSEIRHAFLDYFNGQGHEIVDSSPLVPANDPTLLFTNAGMVQFKDVFLGRDKRSYTRATSSQRCVRAGGKHNDLDNVGYTARHHTFFEMLGNFSFGDYFKREAIQFGWAFLTEVMKLPKEKLWVTVYHEDKEAEDIWINEMGIDPERFSRLGEADNFWQMGDTGPCGPCTEIFYDHGADVWGGPPGSPEEDGDRYIEIWNLVFMQFDRQPDGSLNPLPKPSVDTGMGLERIAAIMQNVHSNYEIDLFVNLIDAVVKATNATDMESKSLRVVADHIRSCAFMIADDVAPSNEGRGYVLRRIIRRAVRHGNKLGAKGPFFSTLVAALVAEMGGAYPELVAKQAQIEKILLREEEQFARTLDQGLKILELALEDMEGTVIPGKVVFKLKDTYGFPDDLTADIARERGLTIDQEGFDREMDKQKEISGADTKFKNDYHDGLGVESNTTFTGYDDDISSATVTGLYVNGAPVAAVEEGQSAIVVLDNTPFYAESGGQIGDQGQFESENGVFVVEATTKENDAHLHAGELENGTLKIGDSVTALIDAPARQAIRLNHSATHLMHSALREVLGDHVAQKGSQVTADRLRFDFSHFEAVTKEEIFKIESIVNAEVLSNTSINTEVMAIDDAKEKGAMALFGEKYGDDVRVLSMGQDNYSVELCGGTHARRTGDIGLFKIVSEAAVAAGVRRLEAVTGKGALAWVSNTDTVLSNIERQVKSSRDDVAVKVQNALEKVRSLEKELERQKAKLASSAGGDLATQAQSIGDVKLLAVVVEGVDGKALREMMDKVKDKLGRCVVVLGVADGGKVSLAAGVSKDLTKTVKAGELVNFVASQVGGKGGGRPDMAMAGGSQPENLTAAIASVEAWVNEKLG